MLELGKANTSLCAKVRVSTNGMLICPKSKLNQFPEPSNRYKTDRKLQDEGIVVHLQVALCCSSIRHCQPHQWAELLGDCHWMEGCTLDRAGASKVCQDFGETDTWWEEKGFTDIYVTLWKDKKERKRLLLATMVKGLIWADFFSYSYNIHQ